MNTFGWFLIGCGFGTITMIVYYNLSGLIVTREEFYRRPENQRDSQPPAKGT